MVAGCKLRVIRTRQPDCPLTTPEIATTGSHRLEDPSTLNIPADEASAEHKPYSARHGQGSRAAILCGGTRLVPRRCKPRAAPVPIPPGRSRCPRH